MRPLIAMPARFTSRAESWRVPATALGRPYQEALVRAGGIPVAVPPLFDDEHVEQIARDVVEHVDAVCLPGGPDVNPSRYGATTTHPRVLGVCDEHDALDLALARAALDADVPLLAICRGHQVLNVALGGTLHQHLADAVGEDVGDTHFKHRRDIDVVAGSRTAQALGTTRPHGHCVHHQAIDQLGTGLVVTARADAIIEGVESPTHRWVVGVQWHPEDDAPNDPQQQALFEGFVAAAAHAAVATS